MIIWFWKKVSGFWFLVSSTVQRCMKFRQSWKRFMVLDRTKSWHKKPWVCSFQNSKSLHLGHGFNVALYNKINGWNLQAICLLCRTFDVFCSKCYAVASCVPSFDMFKLVQVGVENARLFSVSAHTFHMSKPWYHVKVLSNSLRLYIFWHVQTWYDILIKKLRVQDWKISRICILE